jgi:hypothetical protein
MKMKRAHMLIGMTVLAFAVSLLAIPTSHAQKPTGMSRVGWLEVCGPGPRRPNLEIFRGRLAELGYVEGKNLRIEQRFADCSYESMPGLAMNSRRCQSMFCSRWARGRRASSLKP